MSKIRQSFLILSCALFVSCGGGSSGSSTKSLGACGASENYHEYQFATNASLRASFDDTTVAHLETNITSPDDSRDSSTAGVDIIPYTVTDGPRTITVTLDAGTVNSAILKDSNGTAVLTLNKGDDATDVTLATGNYSLEITSDNSATDTIAITPNSCMASTTTQASLSKSVTKVFSGYTAPGVYITELPNLTTIATLQTSVTVLIGAAAQGLVNTPTMISTISEYEQNFGTVSASNPLSMAVWQFYEIGGQTAYIINSPSDAVADVVASITKMNDISQYNIVVIPSMTQMSQTDALIVLAAALPVVSSANAFMIIDYPISINSQAAIAEFVDGILQSSPMENAAIYFPNISVIPPSGGKTVLMGNGSSIAGIYASTDLNVGVWQAPAGITNGTLQNVVSLPVALTSSDIAYLTSVRVNGIWDMPMYGIKVWGARTLSRYAEYEYVNVRRTLLSIQQSIAAGLQPFVFEPNNAHTWEDVRSSISHYLTTLWIEGALFGSAANDAFSVQCGLGTTMTSEDILNDLMIVTVTLALSGPAEFVTVQFTQSVLGS